MGKAYAPKFRKHTQSRTCRLNSCSPCHQLFTVPHCWEMQRCICDTLSRLCGTVGVNPFRDSEAETPGPTPPPTRPAWRAVATHRANHRQHKLLALRPPPLGRGRPPNPSCRTSLANPVRRVVDPSP